MNVGLPGTGIGGVFYLLSALLMPVREGWRIVHGDRDSARLRRVLVQWTLAAGVVSAIWVTGVALGWLLRFGTTHAAGGGAAGAAAARDVPEVLRAVALLITVATLGSVLSAVQVARLIVRLRTRSGFVSGMEPEGVDGPQSATAGRVSRRTVRAATIALVLCMAATEAASQTPEAVSTELARADSAFAAGDRTRAREGYAAVLRAEPQNSRATFQLALLAAPASAEALRLYRRYVALEPEDAWGWIALGEAALDAGVNREAIRAHAEAARRAPDERDAAISHARVLGRTGHTAAACKAYERWLQHHPHDAEAWRELGRERLRGGKPRAANAAFDTAARIEPDARDPRPASLAAAAPALQPRTGVTRDSDGNTSTRFGMAGDVLVTDGLRLGVGLERKRVSDDFASADHDEAGAYARWQPRREARVDVRANGVRTGIAGETRTFAAASLRGRWVGPDDGPIVELRTARSALAASPTLLANDVRVEQLRGTIDLPVVGPMRVRGLAQTARIAAAGEHNTRTAAGGALVMRATSLLEFAGGYQRIAYDAPTTLGYFAPRSVQLIEAGSYTEIYAGSVVLALDLGAGAQRIEPHDDVTGDWTRALRLWSQLSWTLRPRLSLELELEAYESQIEAVGTAANWRYGAAAVSLRWALNGG
jgi:cytochrome c-type biogenesis protein CcmH/NrfG